VPINAERNLRARSALVDMLRTRRAFAVTGAGLSVWAGYPTWRQLINRLAEAVRDSRGDEVNVDLVVQNHQDPLDCVRRLARDLDSPQAFRDFILREFGPLQQNAHEVLYRFARLPFRHILTFNFEDSMERAHAAVGDVCGSITCINQADMTHFIGEMDAPDFRKQVVHLHGKSSDPPESIALTEDGYAKLYGDRLFCNFLWMLVASRRLIFSGFSFRDFDFIANLREAARQVRGRGPCHSAIVGIKPGENDQAIRIELNRSYLIEPVFYLVRTDCGDEDHAEFVELVNGLADTISGPQELAHDMATEPPAPDAEDLLRAEHLADRFVERADPGGGDVQG